MLPAVHEAETENVTRVRDRQQINSRNRGLRTIRRASVEFESTELLKVR
jgi:hypothetical protein